jgi:hypothetical protein
VEIRSDVADLDWSRTPGVLDRRRINRDVRATRDETEEFGFDLDLVKIDADSAEITEVLTATRAASRSLRALAWSVTHLPTGPASGCWTSSLRAVLDFPEGHYFSHVSGSNRL